MNHISPQFVPADARPMTRRALAKMKTRDALIAAAKQLFTERGYEDATVRDIAAAAGMSTGAVFANFQDKADLFEAVLDQDASRLADTMSKVAGLPDQNVRERLLTVLAAGYAFHLNQLPLLQAEIAEGWRQTAQKPLPSRKRTRQMIAIVTDVLRKAATSGELSREIDSELAADLIWQAYLSNYKLAVYDGFDLDALTERLERQLDIVLTALALPKAA